MGKIELSKGSIIHTSNDIVSKLEIVLSGTITISNSSGSFSVSNGAILGILETPDSPYSYTYCAADDVLLFDYPYHQASDIDHVVLSNPKISANLATAAVKGVLSVQDFNAKLLREADGFYRFLSDSYSTYLHLCSQFSVPAQALASMEDLNILTIEDEISPTSIRYYTALRKLPSEIRKSLYESSTDLALCTILQSTQVMQQLLSSIDQTADYLTEISSSVISNNMGDFFDLYSNLVFHASQNPFADTTPIEASVSKLIIFLEGSAFINSALLKGRLSEYRTKLREIEDRILSESEDTTPPDQSACDAVNHSLQKILDYADYPDNDRSDFEISIRAYKDLKDKNSTDDNARNLRKHLSKHFYQIYELAFTKSIFEEKIPSVLKMFFQFGYMDEELTGSANALKLYHLIDEYSKAKGSVLTVYDWLLKISNGEEEPSKNEFDLNYSAYIREQRSLGSITKEQEQLLLSDRSQKLHFEIQNMFQAGNRMTFGRVSTFCPILSEHTILRPLDSMFVTLKKVQECLNGIRAIDYSCYYRETIYTDEKAGITKEYVQTEVLPYFILMPNVGVRGSLWQEIAGSKRDTPARMMLPIFCAEDLNQIVIRLSAEFRWELCKRIQGVHWNDVTDRSLTSEYCDYIQFYRKNHELSQEIKDKIKLNLQKAKNSYREMFVRDYLLWIQFEGSGSPRLNRYARTILFQYCPFSHSIREELAVNPLFHDLIERYNIKISQKKHTMGLLLQKLQNAGQNIPPRIKQQSDYLDY